MQFKQYPSYKDSGVEWLGEVPEHWDIFKSNKIFKQSNLRSRESDEQLTASQKYGVIPQSLYMKKEESRVVLALSGTGNFKHVDKNDFVISLRSFQGGIERCFYEGCVSPAYTVLKPNQVINHDFWAYLFKSTLYISALNTAVDGIREGKTISYTNFGEIYVNIPTLSEQNQIVSFLDTETARIDNLIAKQEKLIELLEEQRKSIISHAVTKGLDPNAPMKDSGVEWLGEVPEHWVVKKTSHIFNRISSGTTPKSDNYKYYENGNIAWLNTGDLNDSDLFSCNKYITSEAIKDYPILKVYPPESIVIAMYGATIAKLALLKFDATVNQACCVFQKSKNMISKYFFYSMFSAKSYLISLAQGAGQPNISQDTLRSLKIPHPSLEEQQKIVSFLDTETARIDNLIAKQEKLIELLEEQRKSIISHAVTGKIDVREYAE